MDELIATEGELHELGSNSPKKGTYTMPAIGGHLEVTLNYPRTDKFNSMVSSDQKKVYVNAWRNIIAQLGALYVKHNEYVFEYCKTGHVHLHGLIEFEDKFKLYPVGAVADTVKTFYAGVPRMKFKQYKFVEKYMFNEYGRYMSPGVCCQYRYLHEKVDNTPELCIERWKNYMKKTQ